MPITGKRYHDTTSYDRNSMKNHDVDWQNQPDIQKVYHGQDYFRLPRPEDIPRVSVRRAFSPLPSETPVNQISIKQISVILALAYGITGRMVAGRGKDYYFRGAPSAGGLYPTEIYLAAGRVAGMEPGLYHYDVAGLGLCRLRSGNVISAADHCIPGRSQGPLPDLSFFLTGITYKSAWKYKNRAYRYVLNDTGHVIESFLATLRSCGISATVHYDMDTDLSAALLGYDPLRETCIAAIRIAGSGCADGAQEPLEPLPQSIIDASKISQKEEFFDDIQEITASASELPSRPGPPSHMNDALGISPDSWIPIPGGASGELMDFPTTVVRRRSRREFLPSQVPQSAFWGIMDILTAQSGQISPGIPPYGSLVSTGLLVQNTEGVDAGYYLCDFSESRFGQVKKGLFNGPMSAACLDQSYLKDAALHFCFMADIDELDRRYGARGYRYAMLEAGRIGHAVYLAATTRGLGACGIGSFYDGEARDQLDLAGGNLLYMVAVGPVKDERES